MENSKALFIWSQVPETTLPRVTVGEKFSTHLFKKQPFT